MINGAIDSHTHFREKLLKELDPQELRDYIASGVEYSVGLMDFHFNTDPEELAIVIEEIDLACRIAAATLGAAFFPVIRRELTAVYGEKETFADKEGFIDRAMARLTGALAREFPDTAPDRRSLAVALARSIMLKLVKLLPSEKILNDIQEEQEAVRCINRRYRIKAYLCVGIHPNILHLSPRWNEREIDRTILEIRQAVLNDPEVIGIGECGLEQVTPLERYAFRRQLLLARAIRCPLVIHTPRDNPARNVSKRAAMSEDIAMIRQAGVDPGTLVFDHINSVAALEPLTRGFPDPARRPWLGISLQPNWLTIDTAVAIVREVRRQGWEDRILMNSDFGTAKDPKCFAKIRERLQADGVPPALIRKFFTDNPDRFYGISARATLEKLDHCRRPISIVLPTYNEQEYILERLKELYRILRETDLAYEIVIVNDGSQDQTGAMIEAWVEYFAAEQAAGRAGRGTVSSHRYPRNGGYGYAVTYGLLRCSHQTVVLLDSDNQYKLSNLLGAVDRYYLDGSDMLIARKLKDLNRTRQYIKHLLTRTAGLFIKRMVTDMNSGFRIFNRDLALRYLATGIFPCRYSWVSVLSLAMALDNRIISYYDVIYDARRVGKSKKSLLKAPFYILEAIFLSVAYFRTRGTPGAAGIGRWFWAGLFRLLRTVTTRLCARRYVTADLLVPGK